jgi:hypothetical protein
LLRAPEQAAEYHGASLLGDRSVPWPTIRGPRIIVAYWFAVRR